MVGLLKDLFISLFLKMFIYSKGGVTKKGRDRDLPFSGSQMTKFSGVRQAKARILELCLGPLGGWQESKDLGHLLLPRRHLSRKLQQKHNSWSLNRRSSGIQAAQAVA